MLKIILVVLALCAVSVLTNPVSISNVRIKQVSSLPLNPFQLTRAENCGYSTLHDVRLASCTSAPCTFTRGNTYKIEAEFTTRGEQMNPFFRAVLIHQSEIQVIQDDLYLAPEVRLEANTRYIFSYDFVIRPSGFTGDQAELRFKVFQNMVAELCVVIPSTIV